MNRDARTDKRKRVFTPNIQDNTDIEDILAGNPEVNQVSQKQPEIPEQKEKENRKHQRKTRETDTQIVSCATPELTAASGTDKKEKMTVINAGDIMPETLKGVENAPLTLQSIQQKTQIYSNSIQSSEMIPGSSFLLQLPKIFPEDGRYIRGKLVSRENGQMYMEVRARRSPNDTVEVFNFDLMTVEGCIPQAVCKINTKENTYSEQEPINKKLIAKISTKNNNGHNEWM